MNRGPINRSTSAWFASLVALLVALGADVLLGSVMPADLASFARWVFAPADGSATVHRVTRDSLWVSEIIIRMLSYAMGGLVAVLLVGSLTDRLLGTLIGVAILATIFEQSPGGPTPVVVALWFLAAPVAVAAGAWVASARRGVVQ
jgi:hypothetical protein